MLITFSQRPLQRRTFVAKCTRNRARSTRALWSQVITPFVLLPLLRFLIIKVSLLANPSRVTQFADPVQLLKCTHRCATASFLLPENSLAIFLPISLATNTREYSSLRKTIGDECCSSSNRLSTLDFENENFQNRSSSDLY